MNCPRMIVKMAGIKADIAQARRDTNTNPTEAQIQAGNYKKGSFPWKGLTVKIENPKGSTRSGTDPSGKAWSVTMKYDYGYIARTSSDADGDAVDIFIGDHPESEIVFIIDQVDKSGKFDEHKCVIGALTEDEAIKTYLANYEKGWKCGPIRSLTVEQFKEWVMNGDTGKPLTKQTIKISSNLLRALKPNEANILGAWGGALYGGPINMAAQYRKNMTGKGTTHEKRRRNIRNYFRGVLFGAGAGYLGGSALNGLADMERSRRWSSMSGGPSGSSRTRSNFGDEFNESFRRAWRESFGDEFNFNGYSRGSSGFGGGSSGSYRRSSSGFGGGSSSSSGAWRAGRSHSPGINEFFSTYGKDAKKFTTKREAENAMRRIFMSTHPDRGGTNEALNEAVNMRAAMRKSRWYSKLAFEMSSSMDKTAIGTMIRWY